MNECKAEELDVLHYEKIAKEKGYSRVCGIDEVGWGPLAGPLYACAVVLPEMFHLPGLTDSKKLTEKKREALFDPLCELVDYGIGVVSVEEMETLGAGPARWLSMRRAVENLSEPADYALVDGNHFPELGIPGEWILKGDAASASISAASVIAKVSRDRLMVELALEYPAYQFDRHKGYGTKAHIQAIQEHGPCPLHRAAYIQNIVKV